MKKRITAATLGLALILAGCGAKEPAVTMGEAKVVLGDYAGIEVRVEQFTVTDEDVDGQADLLVSRYNQTAASDRTTVEDGDSVNVTLELRDENGETLGDVSEGFINIGAHATYEEVEKGLVGANAGDTLTIPITFPDPYEYDESLSGKQATAEVTVHYIKEKDGVSLDALTDEQAALVAGDGSVDTVDKFYGWVREQLEAQNEENMRSAAYGSICDTLLGTCMVEPFPDLELKNRMDKYMADTEEMCSGYYEMTFPEYCAMIGVTEEDYRADVEKSLTDTLKLELIFTAIGDREGIQYDESEFQAYIDGAVSDFGYGSAQELYDEYGEDYIKRAFRIEYVIDWLIDNADMVYTETAADGQ